MRWLCLIVLAMTVPAVGEPASIGAASMAQDGTITLRLRAVERGSVGEGLLTYRPGDKDYRAVKDHLGGLKPGETKPVAPWPDK